MVRGLPQREPGSKTRWSLTHLGQSDGGGREIKPSVASKEEGQPEERSTEWD